MKDGVLIQLVIHQENFIRHYIMKGSGTFSVAKGTPDSTLSSLVVFECQDLLVTKKSALSPYEKL